MGNWQGQEEVDKINQICYLAPSMRFARSLFIAITLFIAPLPSHAQGKTSFCEKLLQIFVYPSTAGVQVISRRKDPETNGMLLTAKFHVYATDSLKLIQIMALFPEFAKRVGVHYDLEKLLYEYPDDVALNGRLDNMSGEPYPLDLRYSAPREGILGLLPIFQLVGELKYAHMLAHKRVVYASNGYLHFHDSGGHFGFQLLVQEIVNSFSEYLLFLDAAREDPTLRERPQLIKLIESLSIARGSAVDRISSKLGALVVEAIHDIAHHGRTPAQLRANLVKELSEEYRFFIHHPFFSPEPVLPNWMRPLENDSPASRLDNSAYGTLTQVTAILKEHPRYISDQNDDPERTHQILTRFERLISERASRKSIPANSFKAMAGRALDRMGPMDLEGSAQLYKKIFQNGFR